MKVGGGGGEGFLSSPPPPRSFTYAIFRAVFDSRSSFFLILNRTETLATQAKSQFKRGLLAPPGAPLFMSRDA